MDFVVDVNAAPVSGFLRAVYSDQLPFINSRAVNFTALDFQKDEREHMGEVFTIRRKSFARQSVKIKPFASKAKPEARIAIDSPGGRSDIFGKFESNTSKGPFRGRSIAVPTDNVPRTGAGIIRKGWRPAQLFAEASQHGQGRVLANRGDVYLGAKHTLLIRKPGGRGTIFRRVNGELVPLYQLVPSVRIDPELRFHEIARETVTKRWEANFTKAFDSAMRTAR